MNKVHKHNKTAFTSIHNFFANHTKISGESPSYSSSLNIESSILLLQDVTLEKRGMRYVVFV
jgi:hypothetical protein